MRRSFAAVATVSLCALYACAHSAASAHPDHAGHAPADPVAPAPAADAAAIATPPVDVRVLDAAGIDKATGYAGRAVGSRVYRVDMPRPELKVSADGVAIDGGMLPTWATFQPIDATTTMMMADVTLLENQVTPLMRLAHEQGFTVSALHNHYLWESPRLMFMHFEGMGDARKMAEGIGTIFKQLQVLPDPTRKKITLAASKTSFDAEALNSILGRKGVVRNGRYALAIDRPVTMHGHEVAPGMMMGAIIVLIGSPEIAYTTGDIAVVDSELQPVLKSLIASNFEIVSIHNHMTTENPRYFYIHFWASRPGDELARELKKALDLTAN